VAAIASAHDAVLTTRARAGGGLEVTVAFPQVVTDDLCGVEPRREQPAPVRRLGGMLGVPLALGRERGR
jgi:hypothetical protein